MLHFKMILVRLMLIAVIFVNVFDFNESCEYTKFTVDHTGCKKQSPGCKISKGGLEDSTKSLLLKEHNEYRNKIATGQESRAGGMPAAADMLEMVWDKELAEIAQKHAEQCKFEHDCPKCREVERFSVGQNMHIAWNSKDENNTEEFLKKGLKDFYDEIDVFKNNLVPSFKPNTQGKTWGHFTQMIWAESWKLGCGYVKYEDSEKPGMTTQFAVCNYGPGGNILNKPIYKAGKPASACPGNSSKSESFSGLCTAQSGKTDTTSAQSGTTDTTAPKSGRIDTTPTKSGTTDTTPAQSGSTGTTTPEQLGRTAAIIQHLRSGWGVPFMLPRWFLSFPH